MNEYQIDYKIGNITDNSSIQSWLGNQKNNIKSIEDYTFDGTAKIIGLKKDGYMFHFNSDGTEVEMYNIIYELAGGTNEENAVTSYSKGDTVQLPVPTKEGAQFLGWSRNNNDTENTISNIKSDMEGDITLYACWINELPEDYFTYNTNGDEITGFSSKGLGVYDNAQEMDLILPSKHKVNNIDVTITSVSGFSSKTKIKRLIIPNTITSIVDDTFAECTGIKYLKIPISINCSNSGFINVNNIEEVYFCKGNGAVVNYTQYNISSTPWNRSKNKLTKITLEKGITSIGNYMFSGCSNIINTWEELINIKEELNNIGEKGFSECSNIKGELIIPNKITSIQSSSFYKCEKIEKLIILDNITTISNDAFAECTGIKYLKIPISINCSNSGFINVTNVEEVYFCKGNGVGVNYNQYNISSTPWNRSKAKLTKISLEKGITSIGNYTFNECNNISTIKFTGTETEWNAIAKGSYNTILSTVAVECEN